MTFQVFKAEYVYKQHFNKSQISYKKYIYSKIDDVLFSDYSDQFHKLKKFKIPKFFFLMNKIIYDNNMSNNYKYPYSYSYPQPEPLQNQYKYAVERLQMEVPLPGYSVKVPFTQKPTRFLNVNRRKREVDFLRDHILHKVSVEQMYYQAKIQQIKKENQQKRRILERMLNQQPKYLFQVPQRYTEESKSINSDIQKLSLRNLNNQKHKLLVDSIDKLKIKDQRKSRSNSMSYQQGQNDSQSQQKNSEQKQLRQHELDYIYKKNGATNLQNHFGIMPVIKKQQEIKKQKEKEKKQNIEWIQKVIQAKKKVFAEDKQSMDSSQASQTLTQKNQKQQNLKQARKQDNANKQSTNHRRQYSVQENPKRNQSVTERKKTPSRESQISDISQFSRYANKNDIFNKKRMKPQIQNIFEIDSDKQSDAHLPITQRKGIKKNWKM